MTTNGIKTVMIEIDGKKVPMMRIPMGISGLTPETKHALEKIQNKSDAIDADERQSIKLKNKIEYYYNTGDINCDSDVEEHLTRASSPDMEFEDLFDNRY